MNVIFVSEISRTYLALQAHLLSCIEQCLSKASDLDNQDEDEVDDSERREFEQIMTSLTRRMIKCDMEDFELVCVLIF